MVAVSYRTDFPERTIQSRALATAIRVTVKPVLVAWSIAPTLPWPYRLVDHLGRVLRKLPVESERTVELPNCATVLTTPLGGDTGRYVVYLHGGAFLVGGRQLHRRMITAIADATSAVVSGVAYRKRPAYPITDAVEDCVDAYRDLLDRGIAPESIAFVGDSAGGYLVLATAVTARERGLPMPAGIVAMAPAVDLDVRRKTETAAAVEDAVFPRSFVRALTEHVIGPGEVRNLLDADLSGLPPTMIQVSDAEMLYGDGIAIADALDRAGVPCELQVWHGQVHVFQAAAGLVPESTAALAEVVRFVGEALAVRSGGAAAAG